MIERTIRQSPAEYINQVGILKELPDILSSHDYQNPVVLTDKIVCEVIKPYLPQGFLNQYPIAWFEGNATQSEIDRLTGVIEGRGVILAFGGGQLMDTAKVVADNLEIALINIPTLPSNCAALTTKSILYSEGEHEMVGAHRQKQAVSIVLVEPELLKHAPYEYILSGIGDTLAKFYEIRLRLTFEKTSLISRAIGKFYLDICREQMLKVTDISELTGEALTNFLDTIFLVAASVDGIADFDGRSVLAHAFYNAYVKWQKGPKKTHGEVVALGNLFQLYVEGNQDDLVAEVLSYHKKVGLPIHLEDVYWDIDEVSDFADYICNPEDSRVQSLFPGLSKEKVLGAIQQLRGE
ncbi:iron-containing alcohol dehydrogenase family protein [Streptococcus dentasini]